MKENKEKREFARQLEQIAETLTQAVKNNEGRAFILIGTDRKESDDNEDGDIQGIIAVGGTGEQVIEGLANFFAEEEIRAACCRSYGIGSLEEVKPASRKLITTTYKNMSYDRRKRINRN